MMEFELFFGGLGFIGQNLLLERLKTTDRHLVVFDFRKIELSFSSARVSIIHGDYNNHDDLENLFKKYKFQIVFNLFSTTVPSNSNENIPYDIQSNLGVAVQILILMKKYNAPKIVFFSSGGTVYGISKSEKISESHPTHPISSHGIIKLGIEKYIEMYGFLHGIEYLILRVSNPYGERHLSKKQGFINVILRKILANEEIVIWGDGSVVRDFIYVQDLVKIVNHCCTHGAKNQILNIGSGQGISIREVLNKIVLMLPMARVVYKASNLHDVPRVVLDIRKMQDLLDFKLTELDDGIQNSLNWYTN